MKKAYFIEQCDGLANALAVYNETKRSQSLIDAFNLARRVRMQYMTYFRLIKRSAKDDEKAQVAGKMAWEILKEDGVSRAIECLASYPG